MTRLEDKLQQSFDADCATELRVVDIASTALVHTILNINSPGTVRMRCEEDGTYVPEDPKGMIRTANVYIGSRGVRAIRAGRAVLARGFESEARALDRIVVELNGHRKVILADGSGHEAVKWLRRESRWGIGAKVAALGGDGMYDNLSSEAHGDPLPLYRMLDASDNMIDLAPQRTRATRASLLMYAGFAHDQANVVAAFSDGAVQLEGMDSLAEEISAGWRELIEEVESEGVDLEEVQPPLG